MDVDKVVAAAVAGDGVVAEEVMEALRSESLLAICRGLREHLCTPQMVQPAMRLLASVAIGRAHLSSTDLQLLFSFFAEKLAQHEFQTTSLSSLALLVSDVRERHACDEICFKAVSRPFLQYVRVQQMPLNFRKHCFCIMSFLFTETTVPLCDGASLAALLELLDGESDPELVLQAFDLHVTVAVRATREAFAAVVDEYFESVSSYFPVVFSQPPGCKVTKSDLRTHLKRCLCLSVYSDMCIPFMQGKLASPSTAVKEDVLDVLLTCFDTCRSQDLAPHYGPLVALMKNEVVKLSSFADRSSNATLTKCMLMGCEVLGRVSAQCRVRSQSEALEVFGPVLEGFLAALTADTSVCSAYATMVFHVLTGSWECCIAVASYLFSMLAMSIEEAGRPANGYLLFAALASGMLDGLSAFPDERHAEQLRRGIERSTALVAEALSGCALRWRGALVDAGADPVDDFTLVCGCEFLVAVLKLAAALKPWLPEAAATEAVDTVVWVALHRSTEVAAKVCRLLREQSATDAARMRAALARLLHNRTAPPEAALFVTCELASTSPESLLLAFTDGFLSADCAWMAEVAVANRAAALLKALQLSGDTLEGTVADAMTALLCRGDVAPEFFECACRIAACVSGDVCVQLLTPPSSLSLLGTAALLCNRDCHLEAGGGWAATAAQLIEATSGGGTAWCRVGAEGVTGLIAHHLLPPCGPAFATPTAATRAQQLRIAVALLWGRLLVPSAAEDSAMAVAASSSSQLVSAFVHEHLADTGDALSPVDASAIREGFSYIPFLASQTPRRPSLLRLFLACEAGRGKQPSALFCFAVQCLVETEAANQVQDCLADLLGVARQLVDARSGAAQGLARELLFSIDAKCPGSAALARAVLFSEASVQALLDGTSDASLAARCRTLHLIRSLAQSASALVGDAAPEEKAALARTRDCVLEATKRSLGDHKRKVRQASAACRHEWYKVK